MNLLIVETRQEESHGGSKVRGRLREREVRDSELTQEMVCVCVCVTYSRHGVLLSVWERSSRRKKKGFHSFIWTGGEKKLMKNWEEMLQFFRVQSPGSDSFKGVMTREQWESCWHNMTFGGGFHPTRTPASFAWSTTDSNLGFFGEVGGSRDDGKKHI